MGKKKVRRVKRKNPNLRLVKDNSIEENAYRKKKTYANRPKRSKTADERLRFGRVKRVSIIMMLLMMILFVFVSAYLYIMKNYTVTTVYVEGNVHYTNEEIIEMVMSGRYGHNSLFLSMKYRDKGFDDVPFIQTMDVNIEAKDTIRIIVYEKALAGYVTYLGRNVYFDKDGIVVETSEVKTPGIPQVTGLIFDHVVLYEPLVVENQEVFEQVLNITQQLDKYDLTVDKIYFDSNYKITLLFGEVRILVGTDDIDEKIMKLQYILPDLYGKKGVLDMQVYDENTKTYSFESE